jgi:hypothetical protein
MLLEVMLKLSHVQIEWAVDKAFNPYYMLARIDLRYWAMVSIVWFFDRDVAVNASVFPS